jgi:hypothetical protein
MKQKKTLVLLRRSKNVRSEHILDSPEILPKTSSETLQQNNKAVVAKLTTIVANDLFHCSIVGKRFLRLGMGRKTDNRNQTRKDRNRKGRLTYRVANFIDQI